jgi:hypothetical protein
VPCTKKLLSGNPRIRAEADYTKTKEIDDETPKTAIAELIVLFSNIYICNIEV